MDNVGIVFDDLEAAKAFFAELGMVLKGETTVEGRWVDGVIGLDGAQAVVASCLKYRNMPLYSLS